MDKVEGDLEKIFISAAYRANRLFDYGETISKEWLYKNFALVEPEVCTKKEFEKFNFEFLQNMEGFRWAMLTEYKKCLRSVRGVGYQIIKPTEQTNFAMDNLKSSFAKEMKKAANILVNTEVKLLTDAEVRKRDEAHGKLAAIAAFHSNRLDVPIRQE